MTFILLKGVPEEKLLGEKLDEVTYDITIDVEKKDLIIETDGFAIWRRYQTYEELLRGVNDLVEDVLGENARVYLGRLPKDVLGLKQLSADILYLYTIPGKKRIDVIAPDGTEVLKMTFNEAESYFKKLDEYVKMLIER